MSVFNRSGKDRIATKALRKSGTQYPDVAWATTLFSSTISAPSPAGAYAPLSHIGTPFRILKSSKTTLSSEWIIAEARSENNEVYRNTEAFHKQETDGKPIILSDQPDPGAVYPPEHIPAEKMHFLHELHANHGAHVHLLLPD